MAMCRGRNLPVWATVRNQYTQALALAMKDHRESTRQLETKGKKEEEEKERKKNMLPTKHNSKQPDYGLIPDWRR